MPATWTGLERFHATLRGEPTDRPPVIPVLHIAAAELIGATIGAYATSARTMADTCIAAYRHYGLDGLQLTLGVAAEASALGAEIIQPPDNLPKVIRPAIHAPQDLYRLRLPDPARDGLLPLFLDATRLAAREVGEEACIVATIRGPLNIAGQIRGIQELMFDLIDQPSYARELLAFANEVAILYGRAVAAAGAHVIAIGEALASPAFISPAYYRTFMRELHTALCAAINATGAASLLHICGDIRPILADMAATGARIIDIDWQVSVAAARQSAPAPIVLRGNLDPVAALLKGTPGDVRRLARAAIAEAAAAQHFVLGSGCDIPPGTPRENIAALVAAAQ